MTKSRLAALGIDCQGGDLRAHARFWAAALGYELPAGQSADGERYVDFEEVPGEPKVFVQRVEHAPRVHIDIETDDIEGEVRRLEALGAREVERIKRWVVMEAPSGHRFCVVPPQRADFAEKAVDHAAAG